MQPEFLKKCLPLLQKYNKAQLLLAKAPASAPGLLILRFFLRFIHQLAVIIAMNKSFFVTAFIFPLLLLSQREEDLIKWNENRKLTWDDFKAAPLKMGSTAAMTTTHLGFSYNFANGKITYKIDCWFEKNKSWGLVKNDWILKHEQGHFDIAEIFARQLYRSVSEYQYNKTTFQKDLTAIYKSVVEGKEKFQQQYDDETDYSRNKTKQEEWLKKIESELKQNKSWAGY